MSGESGQGKSEGGTKDELGTKLRGSTHTQRSDSRGLGAAAILFEALIVSQGYLFGCSRSYMGAKLTRHGCVNVDKMTQSGVGPQ
jgi:hypothetical protein